MLEVVVGLGVMLIYWFGIEEQKQKWLFDLMFGCMFVGFGFIELGVGLDVGSICIMVCFEGDEWIINGFK